MRTTLKQRLHVLCLSLTLVQLSGCLVGEGADDERAGVPTGLVFRSPRLGQSFQQATLNEYGHAAAAVPVDIGVSLPIKEILFLAQGRRIGTVSAQGKGEIKVPTLTGKTRLEVRAIGTSGETLSDGAIEVEIAPAKAKTCREWLKFYQIEYTDGPSGKGIADPITIKTPVNGVKFRMNKATKLREKLYGNCDILLSLARGAGFFREHGITEIHDIGIYNYRCINQNLRPPNCKMSQHARANAIDIAALVAADGTKYDVTKDWVIDPDHEETCTAKTENPKDAFMHKLICMLKEAKIWNIVLTPNYNSKHRDHFHVDLTPGADSIHLQRPAFDEPEYTDEPLVD